MAAPSPEYARAGPGSLSLARGAAEGAESPPLPSRPSPCAVRGRAQPMKQTGPSSKPNF